MEAYTKVYVFTIYDFNIDMQVLLECFYSYFSLRNRTIAY